MTEKQRICTKCSLSKEENQQNYRLRSGFTDRYNAWCRSCETLHSCKNVKSQYDSDEKYRQKKLKESSLASKKRYAENPIFRDKVLKNNRKNKLLSKYNLTEEAYETMFQLQSGKCKICGLPQEGRKLAVDHCHKTGKIRKLLCDPCNRGLGYFKENPELLRKAANYVEET